MLFSKEIALEKAFKIDASKIKKRIAPMGYCFASDLITVQGNEVGYMYRERPSKEKVQDSGWRFFSGQETDDYANDPQNIGMYDVNTIANYDPDIIPFVNSKYGVAFGRDPKTGKFVKEDFNPPEG
jgi:hypothetical protein